MHHRYINRCWLCSLVGLVVLCVKIVDELWPGGPGSLCIRIASLWYLLVTGHIRERPLAQVTSGNLAIWVR